MIRLQVCKSTKQCAPHLCALLSSVHHLRTLSLLPSFPPSQDEPEQFVASMWHKAAINAASPSAQLKAYQRAIETLQVCACSMSATSYQSLTLRLPTSLSPSLSPLSIQSPALHWQKVGYLVKLAEWLYTNHFPASDAEQHLQWAADLVVGMREENEAEEAAGVFVCEIVS